MSERLDSGAGLERMISGDSSSEPEQHQTESENGHSSAFPPSPRALKADGGNLLNSSVRQNIRQKDFQGYAR